MITRLRRIAFPILALVIVLLVASTLSSTLSPVLFALLIAVVLNPLVEFAARLRMPRVATVTLLYLGLAFVIVFSATGLSRQFQDLAISLSGEPFLGDLDGDGLITLGSGPEAQAEFVDLDGDGAYDSGALLELEAWVNSEITRRADGWYGEMLDEARTTTLETLASLARPAGDMIADLLAQGAAWAGGMLELVTLVVLIPFYLFFFLVEFPAMRRRLKELVPRRHQEQVERVARDIRVELTTFLRGRLLCGFVKAIFLWCGMAFLGVPFAPVIALVTGLLSLIPFFGFLVGVIPAAVLALTMPGGGTDSVLWVLVVFGAGEALEGAVLFPLILGRETGLHPVLLVVLLLAGGSLMGTLGVIVAIPLALIGKVFWRELGRPLYVEWAEAGDG